MDKFEITRAKALASNALYAAGVPEDAESTEPFTRIYQYFDGKWNHADVNLATQRITLFDRPQGGRIAVYMAPDGQLFSPEQSFRSDPIFDQSLSPTMRLGRMVDLRQIETSLVACGDGGQNYRQNSNGVWQPIALELFDRKIDSSWVFSVKAKGTTGSEQDAYWRSHPAEKAERDRRMKLFMANLGFHAINGPALDSLYFAGKDSSLYFWDGARARPVLGPGSAYLLDILVEDEDNIWVCGRDGTLMRGNHRTGFANISDHRQPQFSTMTRFREKIYIASYADPQGLFVCDGQIRKLTGAHGVELDDVHTVDAVDDALWVVGLRSIARFDGKSWERIPMPA